MAGHSPPPPGVSSIGPEGQRIAAKPSMDPATRGRRDKKRKSRNLDPIATKGVAVDPSAPPPGSNRVRTDVREIPMKTRNSARATASYTSVTGKSHSFRIRDSKGRPLESRLLQALYLAIIEQRLGGDPFTVFSAFKLKIEDINGGVVYPPIFSVEEEEEDQQEPEGFSLGE